MVDKYECANFNKCGNYIFFTERTKEYFIQQGWVYPDGSPMKPKRCKSCREKA